MNLKSYKITIVCPWWGRPDVVELHCRSMKKFMLKNVNYLAILSPEDPHIEKLKDIVSFYKFSYVMHKNDPLGEKLNFGVNYARKSDYIMILGSDDLCDPALWNVIKKHIGKPVFKYDCIYAARGVTFNEVWEIRDFIMGAGRMIRTDIMTKNLYPPLNKGLDKRFGWNIKELGYEEEVIKLKTPMILDIKTKDNITPLRKWKKGNAKKVKIKLSRFL